MDTVYRDGHVATEVMELEAVGSLGLPADRLAFLALPKRLPKLHYIGMGVTESGIVAGSQVIANLAEFLYRCHQAIPGEF